MGSPAEDLAPILRRESDLRELKRLTLAIGEDDPEAATQAVLDALRDLKEKSHGTESRSR